MKNPEKRSCGTISAGINSAATDGSWTQLPMNIPILVLAMASAKFNAMNAKKLVRNPMRKNAAINWERTWISTVKHSTVNFDKKYGITE